MFAVAFAAGVVNSIAGGGMLLTFPLLIWFGLDARVANATSTVALWPGLLAGMWAYRHDLGGSRPVLVRLGITSLLGGAVGGILLIRTPSDVFARLVPFLILFATALFTVQAPVSRWLGRSAAVAHEATPPQRHLQQSGAVDPHRNWWIGAVIIQFASAVYGGYFGAGNGILMLAVLGLFGIRDIHTANGIKNFLGLSLNSVAIVCFIIFGLVAWPEALLMATGAMSGGYYGARAARRVGRVVVRRAIISIGLAIGLVMLWRINF